MFGRSPGWNEVDYWALDLETGGLSPGKDPILAVGMVPIRKGIIRLAETYATLVQPPREAPHSPAAVAVHHILPDEARAGLPLFLVLPEIDRRLREGVLLVHHARIDVTFLKRAHRALLRRWPAPRVVDTVALIWKLASRGRFLGGVEGKPEPTFHLGEMRSDLDLPPYPAHDALTDAIATAELFLALRARLGARRLKELL
jgi:DNA polymerase-3 subunit epsilon